MKDPIKEKTGIPGYPILEDLIFEWKIPGVKPSNYPPYNILQTSQESFSIEIALAGFKMEEISVYMEGNDLVVEGNPLKDSVVKDPNYKIIHKGISSKNFSKKFRIMNDLQVKGSSFVDGMLYISLKKENTRMKRTIKIGVKNDL